MPKEYPSPLKGYEDLPPLSQDKHPQDHPLHPKSFINPSSPSSSLSGTYKTFPSPIKSSSPSSAAFNGFAAFDAHIYFSVPSQLAFATALHERIRREFPELRIYRIWEMAIGPHTAPMFEVNMFTPEQFGAFVPWLVVNRGPLSVLVHPNTGDDVWDHTVGATWLGPPFPILVDFLEEHAG